jgi:hypothetical protein
MGFDVSHSITNLNSTFFLKEECIYSAREMNTKAREEKHVGIERSVQTRYVCIAFPKSGISL